jgi:hypothetical protein
MPVVEVILRVDDSPQKAHGGQAKELLGEGGEAEDLREGGREGGVRFVLCTRKPALFPSLPPSLRTWAMRAPTPQDRSESMIVEATFHNCSMFRT